MIKLFRKIRQNLLTENKFSKYLLYAIGEILLVVIGILIALQINNWNELRKDELIELDVLKEISSALKVDIVDAEFNLVWHTEKLTSQNIIIDWMESDQSFTDSLSIHFETLPYGTYFSYYEGPYKTLNQLGMRIIKNDSLRHQVSKLYDRVYQNYNSLNKNYGERSKDLEDLDALYFNEWSYNQNKMKPLNDTDFKSDNRYLYMLKSVKNLNRILVNPIIPRVISEINKTIELINKEIETRK